MVLRSFDYRNASAVLNANYRLKREVEKILENLDLDMPRCGPRPALYPHQQIQKAFHRHGWKREVLVSPRTAKRHYFDLFKERVAIEIEISNRDRLYRDYYRFALAETEGKIDVGIILLLDEEVHDLHPNGSRNGLPCLEDAADDLTVLRPQIGVPIWVVGLS
jgi:hypothetical protein